MFDTGTVVGFKGGVNRWLLPSVVFPSVFYSVAQVLLGLRNEFIQKMSFPFGPGLLVLTIIIIVEVSQMFLY